jgi:hypothetical protein
MNDQLSNAGTTLEAAKPAADAISLAASDRPRYGVPRRGRGPYRRFPVVQRLVLLAAGLGLVALLAVARWLSPDPSGLGTHRQLGLPPCTIVELFGRPCPSCGMTTAWAHLTRGEIRQATAANAGGTLLALSAALASPWLILSACAGKWLGMRPTEAGLVAYVFVLTAIILADWWLKAGGSS